MSATQLSVFNEAMRILGDVRLITTADDVEAQYAMTDAWPGAVAFVLRQAAWRFALKTVALTPDHVAVSLPGFSTVYDQPADWLRTHALFVVAGALECPIDIREQGQLYSANVAAVQMRYVSSQFADPGAAPWPEHFAKVAAAYLAFQTGARINGGSAALAKLSELFASLLPEAVKMDALADSPWLPFQLDGRFQRAAIRVLQLGNWRYALATATLVSSGASPLPQYQYKFDKPADWIRTSRLYVISGTTGLECPVDLREQGASWNANIVPLRARYVGATAGLDTTQWPELFQRAVLSLLEFQASDEYDRAAPQYRSDPAAAPSKSAIWERDLAVALDALAEPDDPWLAPQLDGRFLRAARQVLMSGFWRFAMTTAELDVGAPGDGVPAAGYPYCAALPADWLRSHAAFVLLGPRECPIDCKEDGKQLSTSVESWALRYVSSTLGLDTTQWPEPVMKAVMARIHAESAVAGDKQDQGADTNAYAAVLADALASCAEPDNKWWRFQKDGRFRDAVQHLLEIGRWKCAIKTVELDATITMGPGPQSSIFPSGNNGQSTDGAGQIVSSEVPTQLGPGTLSPGYTNAAPKPADWLRTIRIYRVVATEGLIVGIDVGNDWEDVDFRDEGGLIHSNWSPVFLRYMSSALGFDSTKWSDQLATAVLAWLEYEEARRDPKSAAVAAAKLKLYQEQFEDSAAHDDSNERPRVAQVGRFVRARFGRGTGFNLEQGRGW